jgi:hypothetical protein
MKGWIVGAQKLFPYRMNTSTDLMSASAGIFSASNEISGDHTEYAVVLEIDGSTRDTL